MYILTFTTPKRGEDVESNEDAIVVKNVDKNTVMIVASDGASTGVFSREWSNHITHNFDTAWMGSEKDFLYGMEEIRKSFKPEIKRPTALRKFLMEGSYATVFVMLVEKSGSFFSSRKFKIKCLSIGDITAFIYKPSGWLEFSFPKKSGKDFNNVPHLFRSSAGLQKRTPFSVFSNEYETSQHNSIVIATDALGEFIFRNEADKKGYAVVESISTCRDQTEFVRQIDYYRESCNMKNDDVTFCILRMSK